MNSDETKTAEKLQAMVSSLRQHIRRVRTMADRVHGELLAANENAEAGWRLAA